MNNIEDIFPLAPMQEGMLFHSLLNPESNEYIEQISCTLRGHLNIDHFINAWDHLIRRHSILRSAFIWEESKEPLQVVLDSIAPPVSVLDWRERSNDDDIQRSIESLIHSDIQKGFDPGEAPLMRITLIRIKDEETSFIWTHHHILFDGWGMQILLKELFSIYNALTVNKHINLPPVRPFKDYIEWIRSQNETEAENFWREKVSGLKVPSRLLTDVADKLERQNSPETSETGRLSLRVTSGISELARSARTTISTVLQAAWGIVLSRYTNEKRVAAGLTLSVRPAVLPGIESTIGLFINTIPVVLDIEPGISFNEWLIKIQADHAEAQKYAFYPLYKIQKLCPDLQRGLLFESIVVVENFPVESMQSGSGNELELTGISSFSRTNYPLTVVFSPGNELGIEIAYDNSIYTPRSVRKLMEALSRVLETAILSPDIRLAEIEVISEQEKKLILGKFRPGPVISLYNQVIHKWFEKTAEMFPDNTALSFQGKDISYKLLNSMADCIADDILGYGCSPEDVIGIYLPKSPEYIACIVAALKAGCTFMVLDTNYPSERIKLMCSEADCRLVITNCTDDKTIFGNSDIIDLPDLSDLNRYEIVFKHPEVYPENLAYLIYTSGSTGRPKGTLLQHKGFCSFINSMVADFRISEKSRIIQASSPGFDSSVAEIFSALLTGAALILPDQNELFSTEELYNTLKTSNTTHLSMPPSILAALGNADLPSLETVAAVGETCTWNIAEKWIAEGRRFINGYGPTEITVGAAWHILNGSLEQQKTTTVPIGRPLANDSIILLDKDMRPVPVGAAGEIFIGGEGIARGYLGKPALTAERFIPDPFSNIPGSRLYRTGDLAVWLPDGSLEFRGRADQQVKIRGYRLELQEISSVINSLTGIENSVVLVKKHEDNIDRLTSFIILKKEIKDSFDMNAFRQELKNSLPSYMIPSHIALIDSFPLTPSGKVDLNALHSIDTVQEKENNIRSAVSPTEELLSNIWAEVLKLNTVRPGDDFFELGGHSLLATRLVARIRDVFGINLPLISLFKYPTVSMLNEEIGRLIRNKNNSLLPPLTRLESTEGYLSFSQKRLWFLDQLSDTKTSYNIPAAVRINGRFDIKAFEQAITVVSQRHQTLRSSFYDTDGIPRQIIQQDAHPDFTLISLTGEENPENVLEKYIAEYCAKPFDLKKAPLFRTTVWLLPEEEAVVLFVMHHIISDGWSMGLLIGEISTAYSCLLLNRKPELPVMNIQYSDYAAWQQLYFESPAYENSLSYWKSKLSGLPGVLELPFDRPRPAVMTFNGNSIDTLLPEKIVDSLQLLSRKNNATLFMTMLAAFQALLFRYTGQSRIAVGSPIAGRTHSELNNLIGFFVNTLVLKADLSSDIKFSEHLQNVRETTLEAYANQHMPFEKLVEELNPVRDLSHSPLFQVMFVFQNLPESNSEQPSLSIEPFRIKNSMSNFELSIIVSQSSKGLQIEAEYNTDLFDQSTIEQMLNHYKKVLSEVSYNPDLKVGYIHLTGREEDDTLLYRWNETECARTELTVPELFESVAARQPAAPALLFMKYEYSDIETCSYSDLNTKACMLAHYLRNSVAGTERIIGISIDRSFDMVTGILGILKAGAAFLPVDPSLPRERIEFLIQDSGMDMLFTQRSLLAKYPDLPVKTILLEELLPSLTPAGDSSGLAQQQDPANLAYIIYTSGTTGRPKGTMLSHAGLINLASEQRKAFNINETDRILQFSSLSFDASVWETVMALLNGAALCLSGKDIMLTGEGLAKAINRMNVSVVTLPPSVLATLPEGTYASLKTIITAGEAVSAEAVNKWNKGRQFINAYGPTETTVCASMFECSSDQTTQPPIGRPLGNFRLYILDRNLEPVPVGIAGELCVGGIGLARGYLGRPDLTAEKFVPDNFSKQRGSRIYRTGDLVKYRKDGNIEYLGRIDSQVKIRGFRIEPGEIESALLRHGSVKDAAVIPFTDRNSSKALAAYIVQDEAQPASAAELKAFLKGILPEFMIPDYIIKIESMPLNSSGKVNRKALPAPDVNRIERTAAYAAPENPLQETLARLLKELLKIDDVSINESFFDLGGHSLLATQYISRIRQATGVELPLRSLFQYPTIELLHHEILRINEQHGIPAQPVIKKAERRKMKFSELETKR